MEGVFVCYRREDSAEVTGRISARLRDHFGADAIFKDVDNIPFGVDFRRHLDQKLGECRVVLAIIGHDWLDARNEQGTPRLADPADFIRVELESALARGIPVVPLLVHGTSMPSIEQLPGSLKDLAYRNSISIRRDPDFATDLDRLINGLEHQLGIPPMQTAPRESGSASVAAPSQSEPKESLQDYLKDLSGAAAETVAGGRNSIVGAVSAVMGAVGALTSKVAEKVISALKRRQKLRFTVRSPRALAQGCDDRLLAYVYVTTAYEAIKDDMSRRVDDEPSAHVVTHSETNRPIAKGAEITIVPELIGCQVSPQQVRFTWLSDWHCAEFKLQLDAGYSGRHIRGRIAFYVESVLLGEVAVSIHAEAVNLSAARKRYTDKTEAPFSAVFVSYAHDDSPIVDRLEAAYQALGMDYLRDVRKLRSGEEWSPRLRTMIDNADIFQLCWSRSASQSRHVEHEWRYALDLKRQSFIRPTYWEEPMPTPPRELETIHFAYLEFERTK